MAIKKKQKQVKLPVWDERMLLLMEHCINKKLCDSQLDFLTSIGFEASNLWHVKSRKQSFRLEHFEKACIRYKVNMNWVMGFDNIMVFRKSDKRPLDILKDAVLSIELELNNRRGKSN